MMKPVKSAACLGLLALLVIHPLRIDAQIPVRPASNGPARLGALLGQESVPYGYGMIESGLSRGIAPVSVVPGEGFAPSFYNPAVLAQPGSAGSVSAFLTHASLAPILNLPDLSETGLEFQYRAGVYGYALKAKRHGFGALQIDSNRAATAAEGRGSGFSLSFARRFGTASGASHSFGASLTYSRAAEAFTEQGADPSGYLMDVGYCGILLGRFRLGFSLNNAGMPIKGVNPALVRSRYQNGTQVVRISSIDEDHLLTPLGLHAGLGLQEGIRAQGIRIFDIGARAAFSQQFHRADLKGGRGYLNAGVDFAILNTLRIGMGHLREMDGAALNRMEIGLNLGNHLDLGMSWLHDEGGLFESQKAFRLGFHHLLEWNRRDWTWWYE